MQQTTVQTGGAPGHTLYRNNAAGILTNGKLTDVSDNGFMYWIGGTFVNAGKTEPKLHVKPQNGKVPLKVNYGSGQGYNDCILYFKNENSARAFIVIADQNKPANVQSLRVKKIGEDPNGYVEVDTELGRAFIKASKLHEDVEEGLEKEEDTNTAQAQVSNKEIAEAYFDGFFKD